MSNRLYLVSIAAMFVLTLTSSLSARTQYVMTRPLSSSPGVSDTDRDRDGLLGPVRRIKTETAKLINKAGKLVEGARQVLETAAYDPKGRKIENAYFPIAGGSVLTGNENYKYDDKGNISEMTLVNTNGSLTGKEIYDYEYDFVGNWIKMTTSVAVIEGGKIGFEPSEVTYRTISYYLDENLSKMIQTTATSAGGPVTDPVTSTTSVSNANNALGSTSTKIEKPETTLSTKSEATPLGKATASQPTGSMPASANPSSTTSNAKATMDSEPPSSASPKPLLKPVSGGVLNGKAVDLPAPLYPEVARRMRASGLVVVEVLIDANGKVIAAKAVSGNNLLQQAAVQAALRARFSPTTLSGQPVRVSGVINYNFAIGK